MRENLERILANDKAAEMPDGSTISAGFDAYDLSLARGLELLTNSGVIKKLGTVGVVCLDSKGMIAAGTSTSGWPLRLPGRVSDSAIIGAGTCATPFGASSATGIGEIIIRHSLTRKVCDLLEQGYNPNEACEQVLKKMLALEQTRSVVALISIDRFGQVGGATTHESFRYQFQRFSDTRYTEVAPTPISV